MSAPTGTRIRDRRIARGVRQVHLARQAGISASYLNLIEHGRRPIGGALLRRIADRLQVDQSVLSEDGDTDLDQALRMAGAAAGLADDTLETAGTFARRDPDWARLVADQAETIATQSRQVAALSDRLSHDPALSEAMHELLSTVSVVRSTAAILAQTPAIDANWLARFHANLDADSRRLASGAEAVVGYFDRVAVQGDGQVLPSEMAARFLDANGHRFDALEASGAAAIPALVAGIEDGAARRLAAEILASDAADAARLPAGAVDAADDPDDLSVQAGGDLALTLRRMGLRDPARGLVECDASGAFGRRKAPAGFPLPAVGAGCPLWPLYAAFSRPAQPIRAEVETPDGARWLVHAVAQPVGSAGFAAPPVLRATMMLTRAQAPGPAQPVGPGCRVCPRDGCAARREPSLLMARVGQAPAESPGQDRPTVGH